MNAGVSEADASEHTGQVHAGPGLQVLRVPHCSVINQSIKHPVNKNHDA